MKNNEVIKQLKDLIDDRKTFMHGDYDDYLDKDVEALERAIKIIEDKDIIYDIDQFIEIIESGEYTSSTIFSDEEKKTVIKILDNLKGHLVIRADSILSFCKKAIQYKMY